MVQLDEPYLVLDKEPGDVELFKTLYTKILSAKGNVKVLLNTYFGHIADVYETVNLLASTASASTSTKARTRTSPRSRSTASPRTPPCSRAWSTAATSGATTTPSASA